MFQESRFNEEWWWVFNYGISVVIVIILNLLLLISWGKNSFLKTNTNRVIALLATRNVLRAIFSLFVLYFTRWSHPMKDWKNSDLNTTKLGYPFLCDILCSVDTFLLALPMYLLVGLAVHMFTRFPSPQIGRLAPQRYSPIAPPSYHRHTLSSSSYSVNATPSIVPPEPCLVSFFLPTLPILMSALLITPIPFLHLTHSLKPVPEKQICADISQHLTFDVSVFILAFCLPFLLILFLGLGLILRRCVQCSGAHCCNSWCKEEAVFIQMFLCLAVAQFITFLPTLDSLAQKLDLNREALEMLSKIYYVGRPEVGRAIEMLASGLVVPILCYLWLPTYRSFSSEPDPDDLRLTKPRKEFKKAATPSEMRLAAARSLAPSSSTGSVNKTNESLAETEPV
ncbi:hypothetical protein TCAL_05352 [Tigriopus californicus]|uniref:G-protein coupled receptors family 1 profile domain-containing protein n=1 Tax=Tigriopus californicus TaxID=6832 RepID=A0A553NPY8_TIGCA|nr:hypothetical protein TCAL_05352 [Tigriopus californicus]|eukprot:TCALIF_05352-PA protein Name:"Protein of unknown function" AED:0.00 eAED:0.00 QI:398/1/0.8/1/1/0.8/5/0/395